MWEGVRYKKGQGILCLGHQLNPSGHFLHLSAQQQQQQKEISFPHPSPSFFYHTTKTDGIVRGTHGVWKKETPLGLPGINQGSLPIPLPPKKCTNPVLQTGAHFYSNLDRGELGLYYRHTTHGQFKHGENMPIDRTFAPELVIPWLGKHLTDISFNKDARVLA